MNIFDMLVLAPGPFPTITVENRCWEPTKFGKSYVVRRAGPIRPEWLRAQQERRPPPVKMTAVRACEVRVRYFDLRWDSVGRPLSEKTAARLRRRSTVVLRSGWGRL